MFYSYEMATMQSLEFQDSLFKIFKLKGTEPAWYDRTTALLLSLIDDFYEDINVSRKKLDLEGVDTKRIRELLQRDQLGMWFSFGFDKQLSGTASDDLDSEAEAIVEKYNLGKRWLLSVKLLLITDFLVLPKTEGVSMRVSSDNVVVETMMTNSGISKHLRLVGEKKLAITFEITEKVSRRKLMDLINGNQELEELLELLPNPKRSGIKPDSPSMNWGYWAWVVITFEAPRLAKDWTWDWVVEKLIELNPGQDVPDKLQLESDYKRFTKALSKFKP